MCNSVFCNLVQEEEEHSHKVHSVVSLPRDVVSGISKVIFGLPFDDRCN